MLARFAVLLLLFACIAGCRGRTEPFEIRRSARTDSGVTDGGGVPDGGSGDPGHCNGAPIDGSSLNGTFCDTTEMIFTTVVARYIASSDSLSIEYRRTVSQGNEKTLQIILSNSTSLQPNTDITLDNIRRYTKADGTIILSREIGQAKIRFTSYQGQIGTEIVGTFEMTFNDGRTLNGRVQTTIVRA